MRVLGVDGGSRWIGVAKVDSDTGLVARDTIEPDTEALFDRARRVPELARLVALILESALGCDAIVYELQAWYPMKGASQAGLFESHRQWTVLHDLLTELRRASPIPVHEIPRATWAHRIVPHTKGGVGDALVAEHLGRMFGDAFALFRNVHERDAGGIALGWLLRPAPAAPRAPALHGPRHRVQGHRHGKNARYHASVAQRRHDARVAGGCTCPPEHWHKAGRHPGGCPMAPPPKLRGYP